MNRNRDIFQIEPCSGKGIIDTTPGKHDRKMGRRTAGSEEFCEGDSRGDMQTSGSMERGTGRSMRLSS